MRKPSRNSRNARVGSLVTDVLITGASGFIAGALLRRLRQDDCCRVTLLSRDDGDIAEAATWKSVPPTQVVFHLAARTFVPESWNDSAGFMRTNVLGTEQALTYCRQVGARLVLPSTYVYGRPQALPIAESHPANPSNPYALSKLMAEQLCDFAWQSHQVPSTILRLFNVYGQGERPEFLIPTILGQLRKGKEIRVQTLLPRRDYIYVDDVVDALIRASDAPLGCHRVNIGSGQSHSVGEIIELAQSIAGTLLPVVSAGIERPQEIMDTKADISLAARLLDWRPRCSLADGLRHVYHED